MSRPLGVYRPGMGRVGEASPQSEPGLFTEAEIAAEISHLLKLNARHGTHMLRVAAYTALDRVLAARAWHETGADHYTATTPHGRMVIAKAGTAPARWRLTDPRGDGDGYTKPAELVTTFHRTLDAAQRYAAAACWHLHRLTPADACVWFERDSDGGRPETLVAGVVDEATGRGMPLDRDSRAIRDAYVRGQYSESLPSDSRRLDHHALREEMLGDGGILDRAVSYLQSLAPAGYLFTWDRHGNLTLDAPAATEATP